MRIQIMQDSFKNIGDEARKLRITPSTNAWKRVEAKLEAQRSRRKVKRMQLLNYAAVALLLIGIGFGGFYYADYLQGQQSPNTLSITELRPNGPGDGIYTVRSVRRANALRQR